MDRVIDFYEKSKNNNKLSSLNIAKIVEEIESTEKVTPGWAYMGYDATIHSCS